MRRTDLGADPPAPIPDASLGTVFVIAAVLTFVFVAPLLVATYPVLVLAVVPLVAAAMVL